MIHWLCTWLGWHGIHIPRMQDWYHLFSDLMEGKKGRMKEKRKIETISVEEDRLTTALTSVLASLRCHHGQKDFSNDSRRKTKVKVEGAMLYILMVRHQWNGVCYIIRLLDRLLHVRKG